MRDDFDETTKETLARRVGYRCSNPGCGQLTSGPRTDSAKTINIGVAAHLTAASPGGARYDPSLSPEERKSIDNGIWLCQNCAKLVDNDEQRYTLELLREWKTLAEQKALLEIEQRTAPDKSSQVKGAALVVQMRIRGAPQTSPKENTIRLILDVAITSINGIASENGAFKLTVARPLAFSHSTKVVFREANFESRGLCLQEYDVAPHAESMMVRWGANQGTVIFPGDWHSFYNNPVILEAPNLQVLPNPTYLLQTELFTVNSEEKKQLHYIRVNEAGRFTIHQVDAVNYHSFTEPFWMTYHKSREKSGK